MTCHPHVAALYKGTQPGLCVQTWMDLDSISPFECILVWFMPAVHATHIQDIQIDIQSISMTSTLPLTAIWRSMGVRAAVGFLACCFHISPWCSCHLTCPCKWQPIMETKFLSIYGDMELVNLTLLFVYILTGPRVIHCRDLGGNQLSGTLPSSWSTVTALQSLWVWGLTNSLSVIGVTSMD